MDATHGPEPEAMAADVVLDGVLQATEPTDDAILHATTTWGDGFGSHESWYDGVTAAYRYRYLSAQGEPLLDAGWPEPPTVDEPADPALRPETELDFGVCDPATRLSMDEEGNLHPCDPGPTSPPPAQPFHDHRAVDHCEHNYMDTQAPLVRRPGWDHLRMYVQTGDIVVDGTEEVEGRELIRLRNRAGDWTWLVDPETYVPVRETAPGSAGGAPDVTTYEWLPRTPENLALLSPPVPDGFEPVATIADCGGVSVHTGRSSPGAQTDFEARVHAGETQPAGEGPT